MRTGAMSAFPRISQNLFGARGKRRKDFEKFLETQTLRPYAQASGHYYSGSIWVKNPLRNNHYFSMIGTPVTNRVLHVYMKYQKSHFLYRLIKTRWMCVCVRVCVCFFVYLWVCLSRELLLDEVSSQSVLYLNV